MNRSNYFILSSITALTLLSGVVVYAQQDEVVVEKGAAIRQLSAAEILSLKPVVNPLNAPDLSNVTDAPKGFDPQGVMRKEGFVLLDDSSKAFGTFGMPYTTTRVQEGVRSAAGTTDANRLSTTYPYRTIGKLTFSAGYCSASVIRRGVIVTAAHCIQNFGSGTSTFSNFQFRPGHYGAVGATAAQIAPYGTWNSIAFVRPASWANGTDTGCGAARNNDLAVIALAKNASGQFIGDVVGKMSYGVNNYSFVTSPKTGNLHTAAVSTLGYPFLMDGGKIMQRTDGPANTTIVCNSKQIRQGSNFTGGSSGGPWVVNFSGRNPVLAGGAVPGTSSIMSVVGVTSWGAADPNSPKDNFSSQFGQNAQYPNASYGIYGAGNIAALLNTLCSSPAPGGGTYASQGYCG